MKRDFADRKTGGIWAGQFLACTALLLVLVSGCTGCNINGAEEKVPERDDSIAIMTWNVQNLFDDIDEGTEYDEFRESAGWTREKYRGRLNIIASAIGGMERRPDVIALQEIESQRVTDDLAALLSPHGYGWTHLAATPGMALGVGLLSRYPLEEARSHAVYIDGEIAPRPMLEARITVNDNPLVFFVCHWKSKLGGDDSTESTRRASARIIVRRLRELGESEPGLPVIIMGDFNENHDEFYRRGGTTISALLPDDPRAAEMAAGPQNDFIVISKSKPPSPRYFSGGVVAMYSPWNAEMEDGSYYYKNEWETIDHFLLSGQLFNGTGWDFDSCRVINYPPFASARGLPVAYNVRTGSGLSDHLPLFLVLKMK